MSGWKKWMSFCDGASKVSSFFGGISWKVKLKQRPDFWQRHLSSCAPRAHCFEGFMKTVQALVRPLLCKFGLISLIHTSKIPYENISCQSGSTKMYAFQVKMLSENRKKCWSCNGKRNYFWDNFGKPDLIRLQKNPTIVRFRDTKMDSLCADFLCLAEISKPF